MFNKLNSLYFIVAMVLFAVSCSSSKQVQSESVDVDTSFISKDIIIVPDTFVLPDMPVGMDDPDDRAKYLVMHYWDKFDFADSTLTERPDITEQAFVDYINILYYVSTDEAKESLKNTLKEAELNNKMYRYFAYLFDKYFYEPNSPFRNEEFYIPVLEQVTKSSLLSDAEMSKYTFQLEMTKVNRVGHTASDFTYTLQNGDSKKLSSLKSEYTILIFSNPDCATCAAATRMLANSEVINKALSLNSPSRTMLTILTVYPDDDIEEWERHVPELPQNWVHSYDKGMNITTQKLYDIKAIPTIYLLDKNKKVILKDTTIDTLESFFEIPS